MKKAKILFFLSMTASLLILSAAEIDGLYFWRNGTYTRFDVGDMLLGNDTITVGDTAFRVGEIDSITFKKPDEMGDFVTDTVYVAFSETTATVTPANVAGITVETDGAYVTLTNDNTDREMTFVLSGQSSQGSFTYNGSYKTCIQLAGVSLKSNNGAALDIKCGKRIALELLEGTDNYLEDCAEDLGQKAALYCKGHLEVSKGGTLSVKGNCTHAIKTKEYMLVKSTTGGITVTGAEGDGIHAGQYFKMNGSTVNISGVKGDGIQAESTGEDDDFDGQMMLRGGTVNVSVTERDVAAIKCDSLLAITGGTITVSTTGDGDKGFKSKGDISISGGDITVNQSGQYIVENNDPGYVVAVKAGGNLDISGGSITIQNTAEAGKGLSADGDITVSEDASAPVIDIRALGSGAALDLSRNVEVSDSESGDGEGGEDGDEDVVYRICVALSSSNSQYWQNVVYLYTASGTLVDQLTHTITVSDKPETIKPDWEHLEAQNQGEKTEFAKHIANRKVQDIKPQVLDFKKLVATVPVSEHCTLYASKNPKNDLFSLNIYYHYGSFDNHNIEQAMSYFYSIGAGDMTPEQYRTEMDCLGGSFSLYSGSDYSYFTLTGPEENMEKILELAMFKLNNPRHDPQQLKNLVEQLEATKKQAKNEADTWTSALYEYILYGDSSDYIDHATIKEIKKMKGEDLVKLIDNIFGRDGYITYVGNKDPKQVAMLLRQNNLVRDEVTVMPKRVRKPRTFDRDAVYYCTNKKFLKSDIDLYIPCGDFDYESYRAASSMFNEYMSGSMAGVFFQEIREMRSLAYSTYGYFSYDRFNRTPSYYYGYVGTQSDKTNDAIDAMRQLMVTFPDREAKFDGARDYLVSVRNSNYLTFRSLPGSYRYMVEEEKIDHDNRAEITNEIANMNYDQLKEFHKKYVEGRPMVIFISGNAKKFDLKALEQYGKVSEVKYKQMIKY